MVINYNKKYSHIITFNIYHFKNKLTKIIKSAKYRLKFD